MKICIDLFSGLGGFSRAFKEAEDWEVFTVDLDPENRFSPDLRADILDLRPADLRSAIPLELDEAEKSVILASPPCKDFSIAASRYERIVDGEPKTEGARESVLLVYHTIGLIKALAPDYWWLENPQGYLRQFIGRPTGRVTYCQYGKDYMKPTDLWGEHPQSFNYRTCKHGDPCHQFNTDVAGGGDGNLTMNPAYDRDPAKRAEVPYELSESILEAVEHPDPQVGSAAEASW